MNLFKITKNGYTVGYVDSSKTEKEVNEFYSMFLLRPKHQMVLTIWEWIEDEGLGRRVELEGVSEW